MKQATRRVTRQSVFGSSLALTVLLSACGGGGGGSTSDPILEDPIKEPDTSAPGVASRSPAPDATGVPLDSNVEVVFSKDIYRDSINSVTFKLIDPVWGTVWGSRSYDTDSRTATLNPYGTLDEFTTYTVELDGVVDSLLNPLPYTEWKFRTADLTPPESTASPVSGLFNAPQSITLSCNDAASGCAGIYYTVDGSTPSTDSNRYADPIEITPHNTEVTLKFFAIDEEGNIEPVQSETYVVDTIPPTVSSTVPASEATDVSLTETISATFSEPVLPASVSEESFTVSAADHQVVGTLSPSTDATVVSFKPIDRLECNTLYTATLSTAVTDRAGNPLEADVSWDFTTNGDCTEPTTTASPLGGVYREASKTVNLSCTDSGTPATGCVRLVYTTDGTVPSFDPLNGTVVEASTATATLAEGDTYLKFAGQDAAGNTEAVRDILYSLSTTGFTYVGTGSGLARGAGPVPDSFVNTRAIQAGSSYQPLFIDSTNGRIYAVGTGLYISDDDGNTWLNRSGAPGLRGSDALYARGSRVYSGGFRGLDISTDGGASFTESPTAPSGIQAVWELGTTVFAGDSWGLWRSTDRGITFDEVYEADIVQLASYGDTLYAATRPAGLLVSTDGGASFTERQVPADGTIYINDVHITPDGTLYLATSVGVAITSDDGVTYDWLTTDNGLPSEVALSVAVSGSDIYVGLGSSLGEYATKQALAVSRDSGTSFGTITTMYEGLPGSTVKDIEIIGSRVWAFTDAGLAYSDDYGARFTAIGLADHSVHDIVADANGRLYVASGYEVYYHNAGGISVSDDGGYTFTNLNLGNGLPSYVINQLDVSEDGKTIHVTTDFIANSLPAGYAVSHDGGASFQQPDTSVSDDVWKARGQLAVDGSNVYATGNNFGYYYSHDGGATFTMYGWDPKVYDGSFSLANPTDVVVDASGDVYVGTEYGIVVSDDGGVTFPTLLTRDNGLGAIPVDLLHYDGTRLYAEVVADSDDPTSFSGLAISSDGGTTFTNLTTADGLPDANLSSIDTYEGYLYVGTFGGLAISADQGTSFTVRTDEHGLGFHVPTAVLFSP
ncbi:Ig-like domain-containing protein [Thiohalomonas denitrificans]|uniref:Ig-like domain-containing protein n=1 Tax=Thiohalomonas denitrificans TaxID=415747 RepID=A0A1G5QMT3_9GAMM|nr:Ig-like domain-containing protein [Thiohalomonas denitrificans]SCZ63042.1 Uncharacterized protein SAMN03097708_02410 [Thiohalomonas denitrificans]